MVQTEKQREDRWKYSPQGSEKGIWQRETNDRRAPETETQRIVRRRRKQLRNCRLCRRSCLHAFCCAAVITILSGVMWAAGKLCAGSRSAEKASSAAGYVVCETILWSEETASEVSVKNMGEGFAQSQGEERKETYGSFLPFDLDDPLLILVNKERPLPKDYQVELKELKDWPISVAEILYEDLRNMLTDGVNEGLHFVVCSAYRSKERQQELLEEDIRACMASGMTYQEAYDEVTRETMPPGCSEHSTGLALDIVSRDYQLLDAGQEQTAENRWLLENSWKYGFIPRYPKDKEDITGIHYEAWHFRYVGKSAAAYMHETGMTLEEVHQQHR